MGLKKILRKLWWFIWEDNSVWSWIINIILAFVLIKFVVYPGLGLALSTTHPIVAVVSTSMEHNTNFDSWWLENKDFYSKINITKEDFENFKLKNGFNKGDIIILKGVKPKDVKPGDIIVFQTKRPDPIIHRVIKKWPEKDLYFFQTKGDNNRDSITDPTMDETRVSEKQLVGKAAFKIPWLGWVKIFFVDSLKFVAGK